MTLAAVQRLQQYDWPGNVRELQHVVERAVITSTTGRLNVELPSPAKAGRAAEAPTADVAIRSDAQIRQIEADNIRAALRAAGGKVSGPGGAAELLGLKSTTLSSRIKALGIEPHGRRPHADVSERRGKTATVGLGRRWITRLRWGALRCAVAPACHGWSRLAAGLVTGSGFTRCNSITTSAAGSLNSVGRGLPLH